MPEPILLTGAPGAGKTALIHAIEARGHAVVPEAATDVIALLAAQGIGKPWEDPGFPDRIARLQRHRLGLSRHLPGVVFHDRSAVCTLALARFLGHAASPALLSAVEEAVQTFDRRAVFVGLMGFVTPTAARRIDLAGAMAFEAVHKAVCRELGFTLIEIAPAGVETRADQVLAAL
jgi:predicted ATPase